MYEEGSEQLHEVKDSVGNLISLLDSSNQASTRTSIQQAALGLVNLWKSEEFTRYREAYGKNCPIMPKDYPGVSPNNVYWKTFTNTLDYFENLVKGLASPSFDRQKMLLAAGQLYSELALMTYHHQDINDSFARA